MPANLTPQYFEAEERYRSASDDRERLTALREMLTIIPKHKGTEKLQADIKRKIAQIRVGGSKKGGGSKRAPSHGVERSGAAQIALVGPANSGKSRLLADHSGADPEVADYPFTTRTPTPGIVTHCQIPLQFIDLPPVTPEHVEAWLVEIVRNTDLLLVFLDLSSDEMLDHWEAVEQFLDVVMVSIAPETDEERPAGVLHKLALVAANKSDLPGAGERLEIFTELMDGVEVRALSLETGEGLDALLAEIVRVLDLIRIYTKQPGKDPDMDEPFVLKRGDTVEDAARTIHKDLAANLNFARAWGERFHDGQPVSRDLELTDGDILEFHQ